MLKYTFYRFKSLLSQKILVFWAIVFPIFLASIFHVSFSNIKTDIIEKPINVGLINECDGQFASVMGAVALADMKLFKITCTNETKGHQLLEDNKIAGLIELKKDDIKIWFSHDNFERMIIQEFSDTYLQNMHIIEQAIKDKPRLFETAWLDDFETNIDYLKVGKVNDNIDNPFIINMLSVIAMASLFAAFFPVEGTRTLLANMSSQGIRISISPLKKGRLYFIEFFIAVCLAMIVQLLLVAYLSYVLGYDFADQVKAILLICLVGSIFSASLGFLISIIFKKSEDVKIGLLIAYTMVGSFLAGMMATSVKYLVDTHFPLVNQLNPVALITNSFHAIYYYGDVAKALPYLQMLLMMSVVFLVISIIFLRRKNYDTI